MNPAAQRRMASNPEIARLLHRVARLDPEADHVTSRADNLDDVVQWRVLWRALNAISPELHNDDYQELRDIYQCLVAIEHANYHLRPRGEARGAGRPWALRGGARLRAARRRCERHPDDPAAAARRDRLITETLADATLGDIDLIARVANEAGVTIADACRLARLDWTPWR